VIGFWFGGFWRDDGVGGEREGFVSSTRERRFHVLIDLL